MTELAAQHKAEIHGLQELVDDRQGGPLVVEAQAPEVIVRNHPPGRRGHADRHLIPGRQGAQPGHVEVSGDHDRGPLRSTQRCEHPAPVPRFRDGDGWERRRGPGGLSQCHFDDVEEHRPTRMRHRERRRPVEPRGHTRRVRHFDDVLDQWSRDGRLVHRLKPRTSVGPKGGHHGHVYEGDRVEFGFRERREGVRESGARDGDEHARPRAGGGLRVSHRHEARGQLVRGHHHPESATPEGLEHGDHLRSGEPEHAVDPEPLETVDQEIGAGMNAHGPFPISRRAAAPSLSRASAAASPIRVPARKDAEMRLCKTSVTSRFPPNWLLK